MFTLTNINAMNAAQAVTRSHADVQTSMERLSTGSRINAARDDAAGLAMSQRMAAQIIGINKAIDNASDGVGLLNTADGALEEVSGLLQRMRELSVQAANGSANSDDRGFLNSEYQQLKSEIDRIGAQTEWNGMRLLDGSVFKGATAFQVGANRNQSLNVTIEKLSTITLSNAQGVDTWGQIGSDIDGEDINDMSGGSVSISSDGLTVAIGANGNDGNGSFSGHTRVYQFDTPSASWVQLGSDIDGVAAGDQSGSQVAISGDGLTVAIGASSHDANGHTQVFKYDTNSKSWVQLGADIDGESAGDMSGSSVSLSSDGSILAIGALLNADSGARSGHTRIYQFDSSSASWVQLGADIDGEAAGDLSGSSVSLSEDGQTVAIGAPSNSANGAESGHTRIFKYDGTSASWVQLGGDIDGEAAGDESGSSVALSGDGSTVAIGANKNDGNGSLSGHARIYKFDSSSASWVQLGADIDGESAGDMSGSSVSLSRDGSALAIGAIHNQDGGLRSGHTRLYDFNEDSSSWVQRGGDIDGEAQINHSGRSVALSADGSTVAIGANLADKADNGIANDAAGHVRVYVTERGLYSSNLASLSDASLAISTVDEALIKISSMRSKYGAATNQLTHAIDNLTEIKINAESSMSRIKDADYATETSRLAANQIINEAATAMLAQANNSQELTMSLIKDWL